MSLPIICTWYYFTWPFIHIMSYSHRNILHAMVFTMVSYGTGWAGDFHRHQNLEAKNTPSVPAWGAPQHHITSRQHCVDDIWTSTSHPYPHPHPHHYHIHIIITSTFIASISLSLPHCIHIIITSTLHQHCINIAATSASIPYEHPIHTHIHITFTFTAVFQQYHIADVLIKLSWLMALHTGQWDFVGPVWQVRVLINRYAWDMMSMSFNWCVRAWSYQPVCIGCHVDGIWWIWCGWVWMNVCGYVRSHRMCMRRHGCGGRAAIPVSRKSHIYQGDIPSHPIPSHPIYITSHLHHIFLMISSQHITLHHIISYHIISYHIAC